MAKKKKKGTRYVDDLEEEDHFPARNQGIKEPPAHGEEEDLAMDMGEVEEDIYDKTGREHLLDDDEIEPWEEGFSKGFEGRGYGKKERGVTMEVSGSDYIKTTKTAHSLKKKRVVKKKSKKKVVKKSTKKKKPKKKTTKKKKKVSKKKPKKKVAKKKVVKKKTKKKATKKKVVKKKSKKTSRKRR